MSLWMRALALFLELTDNWKRSAFHGLTMNLQGTVRQNEVETGRVVS